LGTVLYKEVSNNRYFVKMAQKRVRCRQGEKVKAWRCRKRAVRREGKGMALPQNDAKSLKRTDGPIILPQIGLTPAVSYHKTRRSKFSRF